jgi:hypothetical protein
VNCVITMASQMTRRSLLVNYPRLAAFKDLLPHPKFFFRSWRCKKGPQTPLTHELHFFFKILYIGIVFYKNLLIFLQLHRFIINNNIASGVQSAQSNLGATYFHFRHTAFLNQLKSKCGLLLVKTAALRVHLNLDGVSIVSNSHTHPSHS